MTTELGLFADYFQVHVFDEGTETDFGNLWTSQEVRDELAVGSDAVAGGLVEHGLQFVSDTAVSTPTCDDHGNTVQADWKQQHHLVQLRRL